MHLLVVIQKSNVVQHQLAKEGEEAPTGREQSLIGWFTQSEPSGDHALRFLLQPLGTEWRHGSLTPSGSQAGGGTCQRPLVRVYGSLVFLVVTDPALGRPQQPRHSTRKLRIFPLMLMLKTRPISATSRCNPTDRTAPCHIQANHCSTFTQQHDRPDLEYMYLRIFSISLRHSFLICTQNVDSRRRLSHFILTAQE